MTKRIVITGAFSNGFSLLFKGLCRWQIRALDNLDKYCEYIGCDLLVIDNSTEFNNIYNKIRAYGHYYPCVWAPATLCSVYAFLTTKDYDEIIWMDLDLIPNKSKNIFEEMKNSFHLIHNLLSRKDEISFSHIKRKTEFLQKVMNLNDAELYDTNAGLIKMTPDTRNRFDNFCRENGLDIRNDKHIRDLLIKYENIYGKKRYEFICDECIYDAFCNITKIEMYHPMDADLSYHLVQQHGHDILKQKTDRFVHFAGEDKKYIPEFLKAQEEVK
jgi:hypothetical protein